MKYKINLIVGRKGGLVERILYFALHYLRYVLVITQIVVLGVFFYKFKIDQQIIDLKEAVEQKKEIVAISEPLIKEARIVDFKINQIRTIVDQQELFSESLSYLFSLFPQAITLNKLDITDSSIRMEGITTDINTLRIFYLRLKKEDRFKKIELASIKKADTGFEFRLSLNQFKHAK